MQCDFDAAYFDDDRRVHRGEVLAQRRQQQIDAALDPRRRERQVRGRRLSPIVDSDPIVGA